MNYQQTINYLFEQLPMYQRVGKSAYKNNLDTTIALDEYFGSPHKKFKTIHIAGTNGKGSVSHIIASVLQEAGYKVGLHTSPHYKDFRERIKINGQLAKEQFIINFVENHKNILIELKPSFFEITVAMAFEYFAQNEVDIAIIEVGMGGRLDSTNIIEPELSVITNISLDHTQFLGNTIEKIASEKAGIIKHKTPVVLGTTNETVVKIVNEIAKSKNADLHIAPNIFKAEKNIFENKNIINISKNNEPYLSKINFELQGDYQLENIQTVMQIVDIIKNNYKINTENIYNGLSKISENTNIMGRWQILCENPLIVCDSGHNIAGITYILNQIEKIKYEKLHFVFGMVNDKSIDTILKLLPTQAQYYFTQANIPRALNCNDLQQQAKQYNLQGDSYKTVVEAYKTSKQNANKTDFIFVGGSIFVVAEVL